MSAAEKIDKRFARLQARDDTVKNALIEKIAFLEEAITNMQEKLAVFEMQASSQRKSQKKGGTSFWQRNVSAASGSVASATFREEAFTKRVI